uniref:Uncharacterized protein LOC100186165 n=1 Tax=Phallusia mammillata TaxID=59560 RepID=A0A6F9DJ46_9ASCI|nr:uncharacterized protein LOC100186165 [Phallusia mammillata]
MDTRHLSSFQAGYIKTGTAPSTHKVRKQHAVSDEETGEKLDADEIKKRNQRYMNVLTDLNRLRDHYYSVYLSKLEEKVNHQRKEIAAREDRLRQKLLKQQDRKIAESHKIVKKLPRHKLTNDDNFLRKVPKSHFYHLTAVENLMKSRGLLKHRHEIDEFWNKAKADESFWKKHIPPTVSPDAITEHMLSRYSSTTVQSKQEQSMTSVTTGPQHGILKQVPEESPVEKLDLSGIESEPELVFPPKPKFPKLHAFNLKLQTNYGKSLKSLIPESSSETSSIVSETDEHRRRTLHKHIKTDAYQLAVVNTAMTKRLLKKHALIASRQNPIAEISEIWCGKSDAASSVTDQMTKASITTSEKSFSQRKKKKHKKRDLEKLKQITTVPEESEVPEKEAEIEDHFPPLSMDMMLANKSVYLKEPKQSNTVWVNYVDDNQQTV